MLRELLPPLATLICASLAAADGTAAVARPPSPITAPPLPAAGAALPTAGYCPPNSLPMDSELSESGSAVDERAPMPIALHRGQRVGPHGEFMLLDQLYHIDTTSGRLPGGAANDRIDFAPDTQSDADGDDDDSHPTVVLTMPEPPPPPVLPIPRPTPSKPPWTSVALLTGLHDFDLDRYPAEPPSPDWLSLPAPAQTPNRFPLKLFDRWTKPIVIASPSASTSPAAAAVNPLLEFLLSDTLDDGPPLLHTSPVPNAEAAVVTGAVPRRQRTPSVRTASTEPASRRMTGVVDLETGTGPDTESIGDRQLPNVSGSSSAADASSIARRKRNIYQFRGRVGKGGYGEIWSAIRTNSNPNGADGGGGASEPQLFVLKRLFVEKGERIRLSGLREIHFGIKLHSQPHIARFVEYFEENGELWLVFVHEGVSLHQFLYSLDASRATVVSSDAWKQMRFERASGGDRANTEPDPDVPSDGAWEEVPLDAGIDPINGTAANSGDTASPSSRPPKANATAGPGDTLRSLMRQILTSVAITHYHNITHRDLKPSNFLIQLRDALADGVTASDEERGIGLLRLCDFGSGVDAETIRRLYPPPTVAAATSPSGGGPTVAEETLEYAPPEVIFSDGTRPYALSNPQSYDLWSVGVLFLELILGTSDVFKIDDRTRALIESRLGGSARADRDTVEKAALFRSFVEYCIYETPPPPPPTPNAPGAATDLGASTERAAAVRATPTPSPAPGSPPRTPSLTPASTHRVCDETVLARAIQRWDPLQIGAPDLWAVRLIRRLLAWDPEQRLTAQQALTHAYFRTASDDSDGPTPNTPSSASEADAFYAPRSVPYRCPVCGLEFELPSDRVSHLEHAHDLH